MSEEKVQQTSFVTKVIIITVAIVIGISYLTPDFDKLKHLDTPVNKLYLLSFVNNPEALYMVSEHWEKAGKYENAIREMRLAIGLLEMHHADSSVLKRYRERLETLRKNS